MVEMQNDGPVRVLLVEDSIVSRMIAEAACVRLGCNVMACDNVETALRLIGAPDLSPPFDFVLTDMHLLEESGLDLIRRVRAAGWSGFRLPIAVMTAHPTGQDEAACHDAGGQFVLGKPLSEMALGDIIDRAKPLTWLGEGGRILQDVQLVRRYQEALSALKAALDHPPEDLRQPSEGRRKLIALLHEIAGVGSLFGNPGIAEQANVLENSLRLGLPGGQDDFDARRDDIVRQIALSVFGSLPLENGAMS